MGRRPLVDRPKRLDINLDPAIREMLDKHLWSDVENRVPWGKHKEFLQNRILDFFREARLDLEPFGFPRGFYVKAPFEALVALEQVLKTCPITTKG